MHGAQNPALLATGDTVPERLREAGRATSVFAVIPFMLWGRLAASVSNAIASIWPNSHHLQRYSPLLT
jgi:hypothetical protein